MADDERDEKDDGGGLLKRLLKARTILVHETVTDKLARKVAQQALLMQDEDSTKPITVYINSPGGSADSGFAIFDLLRFVKCPVRTVVNGLCASAAVMIFLASKRDQRFSMPNSRFLLHQPSTGVQGSASDIAITAEEILKLKDRYNEVVSIETGKKMDQVSADADRDFWLSPTEAKEYGLVGKVVKSITELG